MKKKFLYFIIIFIMLLSGSMMCLSFSSLSFAQDSEKEYVSIPILMYHSVLKSKKGTYCVTPSMLEDDIKYLKNHGYEAIFVQDIIDYCQNKKELPKKPVVLTFDDGHYNNYFYAYPIIEKYNFKANLNVIGCFSEYSTSSGDIDNPNYSYLTWSEIKTLHDSGLFEIGNHTYKMHQYKPRFGITKTSSESGEDYKKALSNDILKLENKLQQECGFTSQVFAYPFGKYSKESENILRDIGFKAFLTCNEGINKVCKGDPTVLSHLKRINRTGLLSTEEFFSKFKIN